MFFGIDMGFKILMIYGIEEVKYENSTDVNYKPYLIIIYIYSNPNLIY